MALSEYSAVNDSAYFKNWFDGTSEISADIELENDMSLIKLRKTSKKLIKNNFIATGAQLAYVNSILGGKLKIGFISNNKKLAKDSIAKWESFENNVDISREQTFAQAVEMIINAAFADGDILINLPVDKRTGKTYVELIEASRIRTPPKHMTNPLVKEGVEYYASGRLKGYWVISLKSRREKITYFSAKDDDFIFLPVYKTSGSITRKVCHLFKSPLNLRPEQSRQVPVLTGVMNLLRYFNQYLEAVLIGARVSACFSVFVKTNNPAGTVVATTESGTDSTVKTKKQRLLKLQPGMITYLKMNEDIASAAPNKPSDNFDSFILRLAKFVSMTLRIPYEHMFLDLSDTSYSSWRGGSLEVLRNINRWRRDLEVVIKWVVLTILREGVASGDIKDSLKQLTIQVRPSTYGSLDDEKTARANKIDITSKVRSRREITDERGADYEQLSAELTAEALEDTEREAEVLIRKKELSEEHDIIFPDTVTEEEGRDTSDSRREGESTDKDLDEEDAKERRKEDGNI